MNIRSEGWQSSQERRGIVQRWSHYSRILSQTKGRTQRTQISKLALSSLGGLTPQSRSGLKNDESLAGWQSCWSINSSSQLMIAQSLGGMEIVVGMSSLTGGLVLDKKRTGPGKRTPHQLSLHFNLPMPLTSNVYHVGRGITQGVSIEFFLEFFINLLTQYPLGKFRVFSKMAHHFDHNLLTGQFLKLIKKALHLAQWVILSKNPKVLS